MGLTPEQHRQYAAELIIEGGRYGHRPSVLRHLEMAGVEHTAEDAKAIFELINTATITMEFPGQVITSAPYTTRLLAEIDKLNDELGEAMSVLAKVGDAISPTGERPEEALGTLADDVQALVDQRDAARREANVAATNAVKFHHRVLHLEAELAKARGEIELLAQQLGQAVDVLMANGWKQEADRLDDLAKSRATVANRFGGRHGGAA